MATFRELHYSDAPLLLPNAWDVGSALGFAAAGFPAVGTSVAELGELGFRRVSPGSLPYRAAVDAAVNVV